MTARLSTRISIRWPPEPPSEPTNTLVMSVGNYYVDLRVRKADASIDWAMAGERIVLSQEPLKCKWTHEIDSRGFEDPDVGSFEDLPNGDSLEKGAMANPDNGNAVSDYEEVWRQLPVASDSPPAWVAKDVNSEGTTFLGRIGNHFLALGQPKQGAFRALRQDWDDTQACWITKHAINADGLPTVDQNGKAAFGGEPDWTVGSAVMVCGKQYMLLAREGSSS